MSGEEPQTSMMMRSHEHSGKPILIKRNCEMEYFDFFWLFDGVIFACNDKEFLTTNVSDRQTDGRKRQ